MTWSVCLSGRVEKAGEAQGRPSGLKTIYIDKGSKEGGKVVAESSVRTRVKACVKSRYALGR